MKECDDAQSRSEELSWLKMASTMYNDPEKARLNFRRMYLYVSGGSITVVLLALLGMYFDFVKLRDVSILFFFGGAGCGIGFMYYSVCRGMKYQVRFTYLDKELAAARIAELEEISVKVNK